MLVYSWQINTRPYEVAVPAELQTMRGTAVTFSTPHFAASYACRSHNPLILMVISHFVKRNALSRLWPPAWAHIPIWLGNTFLYYISSALCSVNSMPHCAVLLNLWCSTVDLSLSCFTVWPLPKPVTHNMTLCISFLVKNYVNFYSSFPGCIQTLLTSTTPQSSCSETFISNSLHSLWIPLWFSHNEPVFYRDKQLSLH